MINFNNINSVSRVQKVSAAYQSYDKVKNAVANTKNTKDNKDEVILSAESLEKQAKMQQLSDTSFGVGREERVESLARKVQSNTYAVNAYDVASKFIDAQKGV